MQRCLVLNLGLVELFTKEIIGTILQFCFITVLPQNILRLIRGSKSLMLPKYIEQ